VGGELDRGVAELTLDVNRALALLEQEGAEAPSAVGQLRPACARPVRYNRIGTLGLRERALRSILLIRAVEEADREGTLLPAADRAAATRDAARGYGEAAAPTGTEVLAGPLPGRAQRLLAARAQLLHARLAARFPVVDAVLTLARGPWWVSALLLAVGFATGISLSALDGTRRINVLAFPLLGLVLWNLLVYLLVVIRWSRSLARHAPARSLLARLLAQSLIARLRRLISRAAAFNTPLAGALGRFLGEWYEATRPLLVARATRLLHLGAAAVGLGLIGGLYLRGIALDYQAGWESTFLTAGEVRAVLAVAYGPASRLTGIPVHDPAHLAAIRWEAGHGGENAAPWIHLLAVTALLHVVLPRLALAAATTLLVWRHSLRAPAPASLVPYFRAVFSHVAGAISRGIVALIPYAYEPSVGASSTLQRLLPAALGENLAVDVRAPIHYGDEDDFLQHLPERGGAIADAIALLFSLAATPEDQSHGHVIAGVRDWLTRSHRQAQLLVLIDEGPYAARMSAQAGLAPRLAERRDAWEAFVAARGLKACFLDLAERPATTPLDAGAVERMRAALWQPGPA
jgi:hypothetical protein